MKKVKWIILNSHFTLEEMTEKLSKDPFTEDKGKGFVFEKIRDGICTGRFIEKVIIQDKIGSLYGEVTTLERVDYRSTNFSFESKFLPIISIHNPPRTLKPFAQAIVRNIGLGVSIEEMEVDPFKWYQLLLDNLSLTINQLDVSQVKVAEFALAKMQINSSHDLKKYFLEHLQPKELKLERLTASIHDPNHQGKLKLSRNGLAHIESKGETALIGLLQSCLISSR